MKSFGCSLINQLGKIAIWETIVSNFDLVYFNKWSRSLEICGGLQSGLFQHATDRLSKSKRYAVKK
jgi:hypothetical protein